MLETGRVLNQYEIVRLLGKGGMGEVYVARDTRLGREVALKVLPEELAENDERRERFEREARSVAALQHPNIVTLHSIEESEGLTFLVMELIGGEPLTEVIPRGGLSLDRFLEIAIPLADAVAAAHARGITHRDLKPDNVLIDGEGRPQILDFGLAKVTEPVGLSAASMEPTEALTGEGKIVGTIAYMSPEQVEGRDVDARSDIFSLGVILYEMATGARPFEGDTSMSVLTSILRDEPDLVTERNERLPRYLGRVVKRCLQKEPSRRFQSALDLRNDLDELKEELASGELTGPGTAGSLVGRRPPRWLPLTVGILVVAALGVWWSARRGAERTVGTAEPSYEIRRLTVRGSPEHASISPDGRYVAYVSEEVGGRSLRLHQVTTGSDIELVPQIAWNQRIWGLHFTPDGDYVRYVRNNAGGESGTLWEIPVLGGTSRRLADDVLAGVTQSPDGRQIAFVTGESFTSRWAQLDLLSLDDGSRETLLDYSGGGRDINGVAWSPDGRRLAVDIFDDEASGLLVLLSLDSGETVPLADLPFTDRSGVCWTPDGSEVLVLGSGAAGQTRTQLWRVALDGDYRSLLAPDFNSYQGCSSTADGTVLATIREERRSQVWIVPLDAPRTARALQTTTGRDDGSGRVSWLDPETVVYGAPGVEAWSLWRVGAEGGASVPVGDQPADHVSTALGTRLAFQSGWSLPGAQGVYGLDLAEGRPRRLSPEARWANRPALSRDGEWVYYELLTGSRMRFVRSPWEGGDPVVVTEMQSHQASFSPDGRRIALHAQNPETGRWQTAIFPVGSSPGDHWLDVHSESYSPWASNDAIYISRSTEGVANVYRVNVDDGSEEQVTFFTDQQIFSLDVSPDLTRLAVGRGEVVNDLLLIEGLFDSSAEAP